MHTLNQPDKKKATANFILIYASSLGAVLLLSYFLFSTPLKIFKGQLKKYSDIKVQHDALLDRTDSITTNLVDLIEVEKLGETSADPAVDSLIMVYHQRINSTVDNIRKDSANNAFNLLKNELTSYLTAYNAVLLSPSKRKSQLGTIAPPVSPVIKPAVENLTRADLPELQKRLTEAIQQNQLVIQQNTEYREQIRRLNEQIVKLSKQQVTTNQQDITSTRLAKENQDLQDQVSNKTADVTRLTARVKELEEKQTSSAGPSDLSAADKASIRFQTVDQLITGALSKGDAAKGICAEARKIMQDIKGSYSNKSAYDQALVKLKRFCEVQ